MSTDRTMIPLKGQAQEIEDMLVYLTKNWPDGNAPVELKTLFKQYTELYLERKKLYDQIRPDRTIRSRTVSTEIKPRHQQIRYNTRQK